MKYTKLTASFLYLISCLGANAVYFVHDTDNQVKDEEIFGRNSRYSDVCMLVTSKDGQSKKGTGTFIADDIVLTAAHVVSTSTSLFLEGQLPPESIHIYNANGNRFGVEKVMFYKQGLDDLALLQLDTPFKNEGEPWRKVRAIALNDPLPSTVSIVGYGSGRVIHESMIFQKDLDNAYLDSPLDCNLHLRFRENIKTDTKVHEVPLLQNQLPFLKEKNPNEYGSLPDLILNSLYERLSSGDSGGPLIEDVRDIIGVASFGPKSFINIESTMINDIDLLFVQRRTIGLVAAIGMLTPLTIWCTNFPWYTALGSSVIGYQALNWATSHTLTSYLDEKIYNYTYAQKVLPRNVEILQALKVEKKHFSSTFCGFDDNAVEWINSVVSKEDE